MKLRYVSGLVLIAAAVLLAGCPKGNQQYNAGSKAESVKDYDTALDQYNKALQAQPNSIEYQLKAARARFEAGQWHVDQGRRLREQSNLELALMEFRKAAMIDPSSAVAAQEVQATLDADRGQAGYDAEFRAHHTSGRGTQADGGAASAAAAFPRADQHEGDQRCQGRLRCDRKAGGPDGDLRRGFHFPAHFRRTDKRYAGAGAEHRGPGEQGVLASGDHQHHFRRPGPAAKAQGL